MYGNDRLPVVGVSGSYSNKGSIWQGSPSSTWFKTVNVNGTESEGTPISAGTIMKELSDGSYTPIAESDIVSSLANAGKLPLVIVADKTAKTGTTTTTGEGADAVTEAIPSSVLVGVSGQVDKGKILVGAKVFSDLTETQQIYLDAQLKACGIMLVNVMQA